MKKKIYLDKIQNIKDIINNIKILQKQEIDIHNKYLNTNNIDTRAKLLEQINSLTTERLQYHRELDKKYLELKRNKFDLTKDVAEMYFISQITENELDNNKKHLEKLNANKNNKKRLIQLNMYYTTKYRAWNKVMKLIILICVPLLIISILKKKEIIPPNIALLLLYGIFITGGIYIIYRIADLLIRDNLNFDEYYMPMNIEKDELDFNRYQDDNNNDINLQSNLDYCIGNSCCAEGTFYNYNTHLCEIPKK